MKDIDDLWGTGKYSKYLKIVSTGMMENLKQFEYTVKPKGFSDKTEDLGFLIFNIYYFRSALVLTMCIITVKQFLIWRY